jgi:molybdate transport system substrate-binding protein
MHPVFAGLLRIAAAAALVSAAAGAGAAELKVAAPNAVKEALTAIVERFERESGHRVVFAWTGSEAIAKRVSDGEPFDVVLNTAPGIERLVADGRLVAGSRTDFARSGIGVAVRAGLARPDVSSVEALRRTLLASGPVAISSGASGRYLETLFERIGVAEQVRPKLRQPPSGAQIGDLLARGDADLGFQQVTELRHAKGFDYVGPLPDALQGWTVWSAALHPSAGDPEACRALLRAIASPASADAIRRSGMEPTGP